ncbi:MAG TPA: MJ0042-type zinc finger domain-containing protein [Stellaceae bacterium]|nr:MJ0042-type zinc finger domain-containing protein [Stellaceae bacterium]
MILSCPACEVRYRVDDKAMSGSAGRTVRCIKCGHTWHQSATAGEAAGAAAPAPAAREIAEPEPAAPAVMFAAAEPEPPADVAPLAAPPPEMAPPPPSRGGWGGAVLLAVLLVVAAVVLGGIFARGRIVAMWPGAAKIYALAGLPVEPLGAGLEIRKVIPTRTGEGLVVEGEVVNIDGSDRSVPRLRVTLLDPAQKELRYEIIAPPKDKLGPGEVAHFRAPFSKTDDTATKVAVTFASS